MPVDEHDILIWDSEIRRLGAGRVEGRRILARQPTLAYRPAPATHTSFVQPSALRPADT